MSRSGCGALKKGVNWCECMTMHQKCAINRYRSSLTRRHVMRIREFLHGGDDVVTTIRWTIPLVNRAHLESRGEDGIAWGGSKGWFVTLWPKRVGSILVHRSPWGCTHFFETLCQCRRARKHCAQLCGLCGSCPLGGSDMHKLMRCRGCSNTGPKWGSFPCHVLASDPKSLTRGSSAGLYNEYRIS